MRVMEVVMVRMKETESVRNMMRVLEVVMVPGGVRRGAETSVMNEDELCR